jgi:tRNA(His) 5'-end guanylyltransferase
MRYTLEVLAIFESRKLDAHICKQARESYWMHIIQNLKPESYKLTP